MALLIKQVRPFGRETVDVLIQDGKISRLEPDLTSSNSDTTILEGGGQLLLPGLVNAHAHVDKTLLGLPLAQQPSSRLRCA